MTSKITQRLLSNISFASVWKLSDLRDRILFTVMMVVLYRIGVYTPIPGIDTAAIFASEGMDLGGYTKLLNSFSGGALARCSIMALGFSPYISASIIMQIYSTTSPEWMALKKEGEAGRAVINQYTKYCTVFLCLTHSIAASVYMSHSAFVIHAYRWIFPLMCVLSLTSGTMLVVWMSEQIDKMGIGQGLSILLCANILSELPSGIEKVFKLSRFNAISLTTLLGFVLFFVTCLYCIAFFESSQRRIPLICPNKSSYMMAQTSQMYIPIKLNTANITPVIFAGVITGLVQAAINAFYRLAAYVLPSLTDGGTTLQAPPFAMYCAMVALILYFSVIYVPMILSPAEIAENLNNNGNFIPGYHPGAQTIAFLEGLLFKISIIGGIYLSVVYIVPGVVTSYMSPALVFSGTSMLIVVNVITETLSQIGSYTASIRYQSLEKTMKQGAKSMMRRFRR